MGPPPGQWDRVGLGAELGGIGLWFLTPSIVFLVKFLTLRGWC